MKSILFLLVVSLLSFGCASTDSKPGKWAATTSSWSATVVSIDYKSRIATLIDQNGNNFTFKVRDEVKDLEKVKTGDIVDVESIEAYAIYVRKSTDEPYLNYIADEQFESKDGMPTKTVVASIEATGLVAAIDYKTRVMVLKRADGKLLTIHVPAEVEKLKQIKTGDEIVTRYTQNTIYSVRKK